MPVHVTDPVAVPEYIDPDLFAALTAMGLRFHGFDLTYRRHGPKEWARAETARLELGPGVAVDYDDVRWRARLVVSKNEQADHRRTAFGYTANEAITKLLEGRNTR